MALNTKTTDMFYATESLAEEVEKKEITEAQALRQILERIAEVLKPEAFAFSSDSSQSNAHLRTHTIHPAYELAYSSTSAIPYTPAIGMGVTHCIGSDRYPGKIVELTKKGFYWEHVEVTNAEGSDNYNTESQKYIYGECDGHRLTARMHSDGHYYTSGLPVSVGRMRKYRDPSF